MAIHYQVNDYNKGLFYLPEGIWSYTPEIEIVINIGSKEIKFNFNICISFVTIIY